MIQKKNNQSGFTIVEVLVTAMILICLLAISSVAIVKHIRRLQITEVDNAAREIYMAAQNRAILLKNNEQLDGYVIKPDDANQMKNVDVSVNSDATTQITAYYIHSTDENIEELVPKESIEPSLYEGDFYIVYEPGSASVIDVFFAKEPLSAADFPSFFETWRAAPKDLRMKESPMIGYYGGESAESGTSISLRTPVINIYNEETLRAEVTYWVPQALRLYSNDVELEVTLDYQGESIQLEFIDSEQAVEWGSDYDSYTFTWVLDSLEAGKQFKDHFMGTGNYGGDFTITAEVLYTGDTSFRQVNGARKTAADNSLFAKGSSGETAYIEYMRHLQNLSEAVSGVSEDKTSAVQNCHITCTEGYNFQPIENDALQSYDGQDYEIRELNVTGAGAAGLFGSISDKQLSHITLINASVSGSGPTGALVGMADRVQMDSCRVYWENDSAADTNLRKLLGDSESGILYKITSGSAVGGLAGSMKDSSIKNSFSATTLSGAIVGGLVGQLDGATSIEGSYGDNYLKGGNAGGLVGDLTGTASITDSYAAGFINSNTSDNSSKAAGLCAGSGTADLLRVYSVMLFTAGADNYPLCEKIGTYQNTYYLNSAFFPAGNVTSDLLDNCQRTYTTLADSTQISALFGSENVFEKKSALTSFPYNLQTTLSLTAYSYPGIRGLQHYGDWGVEFQNGSLVYYEAYKNAAGVLNYSFNGGNMSLPMQDYAITDGYAVAFLSNSINVQSGASVNVTYMNDDGVQTETRLTYQESDMPKVAYTNELTGKVEEYYLLPLPGYIVNTAYASGDFYQEITFSQGTGEEAVTGHYYYNPHFANAVLTDDAVAGVDNLASLVQAAEIRTPRHLYMLSTHEAYYSSYNRYTFIQELDLDYSVYSGYGLFSSEDGGEVFDRQSPIGVSASRPFRGNYYGNCHTIENVTVTAQGNYAGLFGYSTGTIADVAYLITADTMGKLSIEGHSGYIYVGGLVGYNGGIIQNCAVSGMAINIYAYSYSTIYSGGLAGWNQGAISDSSAALTGVTIDTTLSNAYAGGFVGTNSGVGIITRCYAVGRINVSRAQYGSVYACGFGGSNHGTISRCYAAADLQVSGGAVAYGFCKDASRDCVYLNGGNFKYDGTNFTAQYQDDSAAGETWSRLASGDSPVAPALGMNQTAISYDYQHDGDGANDNEPYPYPGAVKNSDGDYIHYGQWPVRMDLGTVGVYYWEKMDTFQGGAVINTSYHFSAIKADINALTLDKAETLSTAHSDGGVITEFGYGYFYEREAEENGTAVQLTSRDIGFTNGDFQPDPAKENTDVNDALSALMEGSYTFHSYNTWGTERYSDATNTNTGLYITGNTTSGSWTLEVTNAEYKISLDFQLNPFFADTLSFAGAVTSGNQQLNLTNAGQVPTAATGWSGEYPYQVRSVDQLQFINWNYRQRNTDTVLINSNCTQFPYLSYYSNSIVTRPLHWRQTHDVNGQKGTYSPIAEFYDPSSESTGNLSGWFGGAYDGDDYVIQDVNIQGHTSSCAGLFGIVYNGSLKNIVIYSSDGTSTVTTSKDKSGKSCWYAVGVLAGLAAADSGSTAIENCSVAGYTLIDQHVTSLGGWGGSGVGGLIGISNMQLSGCEAVTAIKITAEDNDNMRIGGLVGTCQQSISSCYSGGSIEFAGKLPSTQGAYIGGIVGGIYMKELKVGTKMIGADEGDNAHTIRNALTNCYTYVTLPAAKSSTFIKGLYALGGTGELNPPGTSDGIRHHGICTITNCYYLGNVVLSQNTIAGMPDRTDVRNTPGVNSLTYAQMSDGTLLNGLNTNGGGFSTVTVLTPDGESLKGRYSFATSSFLLGEDYPFPTILTQNSSIGMVNIHYGDWPMAGIQREHGDFPIAMDLFADYSEEKQAAVWTEALTLSPLVTDTSGKLTAVAVDSDGNISPAVGVTIDEADFADRQAVLTVTGYQAGYAKIKVTYTTGDAAYTAYIDVSVTAQLQVLPSAAPVIMFSNETASVPLTMRDANGDPLSEGLRNSITLQAQDFVPELDYTYLSAAEVTGENSVGYELQLTSLDKIGETKVTLGYQYAYRGMAYATDSAIALQIITPAAELKPVHMYLSDNDSLTLTYTAQDVQISVDGSEEQPAGIQIIDLEDSNNRDLVHAEWAEAEKQSILIIGHRSDGAEDGSSAYIRLQLQFTYGGSTHTMWQGLQVYVHKGAEPAGEGENTG